VLKRLLKLNPANAGHQRIIEQLDRQAARIATNRVVAGAHFPVDSMAGRMLGVALGEYFVGRCTGNKRFKRRKFIAAGIDNAPTTDFNPFNAAQEPLAGPFYSQATGANIPKSALMEHLWDKAREEWLVRFP
jgi:hypothetical protein